MSLDLFSSPDVYDRALQRLENSMNYGSAIVQNYVYREPLATSRENPPGSNRCPLADKAYRWVHGGANPARATKAEREWCAALYCLTVFEAGIANGPKTASTGGIFDWARDDDTDGFVVYLPHAIRGGRIRAVGKQIDAQPGDAGMILDASSPTAFRHTVCLVRPLGGGWWECIAGNEGNKVSYSRRHVSSMAVVRPF